MKNNADLLLRIRQDKGVVLRARKDKKSTEKNDADMLLRVRQDKKSRVKSDADMWLRVR